MSALGSSSPLLKISTRCSLHNQRAQRPLNAHTSLFSNCHKSRRLEFRFIRVNSQLTDGPSTTTSGPETTETPQQGQSSSYKKYPPLEGKLSYKQIRFLPTDQLLQELTSRNLPTLGYKSKLASRLYQAFIDEGRAYTKAESAEIDAMLPTDISDGSDSEYASIDDMSEDPLRMHQKTKTGITIEVDEERVMSNKARLQATFLSMQEAPNGINVCTSLAVRTLQSVWLFDCGEDTQRTLIGHPLLDWKRVERIFIGSLNPDSLLGLPGMLCTISASRERGHESADIPIHIYGPPGLVQFVSSMLSVSRTYLEMPVIVHEFVTNAIPTERLFRPIEVLKRSRLYALQLPPDQLNPEGYYDAELTTMLARATRKKQGGGADLRSGVIPQPLPDPGDPSLQGSISVSQMSWTVRTDGEYSVTAYPLKNKFPSFGYKITEADRAGRLFPEVCLAMGITGQKDYAALKLGETVLTPEGVTVRPEQVVGPPRLGRKIGIVSSCEDSSVFAKNAGHVDVLIHNMLPPSVAGACAKAVTALELVLWQQSGLFLDLPESKEPKFPFEAIAEAREVFGDEHVSLAGTYQLHQWEQDDGFKLPVDLPPEFAGLINTPNK